MDPSTALRSLIDAVRRRWLAARALRTVGLAAVVAALPIAAAALAGWSVPLEGTALIVLVSLAVCAAAALLIGGLRRWPRRPTDVATARFIEEQAAANLNPMDDALVSAVQVGERTPESETFAPVVVAQAASRLSAISAESIVATSTLRYSVVHAAAGTVFLGVAIACALPTFGRAADAAWLALFPHSISISVLPGDARVPAGRPLVIKASLNGRGAKLRGVAPMLVVSSKEQERSVPMVLDGDGYRFGFDSVDRSFTYKVVAATVSSQSYSVTALHPPRVRRIDVQYDYPAFAGLAPHTDENAGDVYGPAGTRVRLRVHTDKPIAAGQLALASRSAVPLAPGGDLTADALLTLSKDDSYRIKLSDRDGLHSSGDTEYFIRLMDDRPPEVRILRPSADQSVTPLEEVAIEARADDDYGVARFELAYSVAGRPERTVRFSSVTGTDVAKIGTYLLAIEDLRVQPGDVVTYYARAVDVGRGKRPSETRSDIFFLEVKPFSEEFVAAQSQAMSGGAAGQQLDSLIAAQKEIITATWNLERRSTAGQSADDTRAVAEAQAELKARAEQMASAGRRGFRNQNAPQRQLVQQPRRDRGSADPVSGAVEAMARAVEQLEARQTRAALPHEMAALQKLLQAQAEISRRQVQQNANGAAQGGTSRVGQDLSALFDRELQRQQRTNYESKSQIEERPDEGNKESAIDRIRDLARRQEDLSKRQRQLADSGLSAEELKRQLETLTREQEALRAQAEQIERELRAKGAQSTSGSQGTPGSASGAMRGVSAQMRQAAGELQRQNAKSAADRSQDAAEALRRAEQHLTGNTSDGRQRAAGELQLEAQQVAEAQRRVAAEASRLRSGTQGGAATDALRRLAAEKERLAERVDELERASRQLGAQAGSAKDNDPAKRARETAAMLEREQVGRRMRDAAKQMREAASARGSADIRPQAEEEIARVLDRAASALGEPSAERQALSDHLERTRAMRERLNKLDEQLRDAEAGARAARGGRGSRTQPGQEGRLGREGSRGSSGSGQPGDLQRLREEYSRELQRTRDALSRLQGEQRSGQDMSTPETHEFSRSAPGTEAFKQDYSGWDALRREIDLAMEQYEASVSDRLIRSAASDRLEAGGSERIPDAYRQSIARYYQSLAKLKK
jgi:hypothetical protein